MGRGRETHLRDLTYPLYLYLAEESAKTNDRLHGGKEDDDHETDISTDIYTDRDVDGHVDWRIRKCIK